MNMFKSVYMKQVMFLFSIVIIFALIVAVRGSSTMEGNDEMSVPNQEMSTEESVQNSARPVYKINRPGLAGKFVPGRGFISAPDTRSRPTDDTPPPAINRPFMPDATKKMRSM